MRGVRDKVRSEAGIPRHFSTASNVLLIFDVCHLSCVCCAGAQNVHPVYGRPPPPSTAHTAAAAAAAASSRAAAGENMAVASLAAPAAFWRNQRKRKHASRAQSAPPESPAGELLGVACSAYSSVQLLQASPPLAMEEGGVPPSMYVLPRRR